MNEKTNVLARKYGADICNGLAVFHRRDWDRFAENLQALLDHQQVIEQALSSYENRCRDMSEIPATTEREKQMRDSAAITANYAKNALLALYRVGGAA
jgi:hypothetical protein